MGYLRIHADDVIWQHNALFCFFSEPRLFILTFYVAPYLDARTLAGERPRGRARFFMADIFEFWSRIKRGERIHPDDKEVFDRMNPERHGFELDCLPACFAGRLKTASVVLLYL